MNRIIMKGELFPRDGKKGLKFIVVEMQSPDLSVAFAVSFYYPYTGENLDTVVVETPANVGELLEDRVDW